MKIKKIISLLLVVVLCFSLASCGTAPKQEQNDTSPKKETVSDDNTSTPLLYKVTDDDGNIIWLFGSIHVGEDYFYPLPDYVLNAFDNADSLAVEFDIIAFGEDTAAASQMLTSFVITDGSTISDLVDDDVYEDAKEILSDNNFYFNMLDYYMPIFWSDLIDEFLYEKIGINLDLGVDKHLIKRAYKKDKEVLDVESAEFQYNMLAGFSDELQAYLLEESVETYNDPDEVKSELDKMLKIWAKGDEAAFIKLLEEEDDEIETEEERKLYEEYNNAIILSRNVTMANWAEDALKSGKEVFICVGAAHVVGPNAMVDLLKERGYTVEIVR